MTTSPKLDLDVPTAELAVLQTLWELGSATIRQLADVRYPGGQAAQYGTVQKLLERLEQRGCVIRDRDVWPHVFTPAVDRETLIGHRLRQTAEKLCGGSMTPILIHLMKADQLSDEERQELHNYLSQLHRPKAETDPGS